ncbi:MAG: DUF1080 domain-containing protein [Candidatus Hydrogenedentes bacterium]|nr:DUF1080 domain-containing protein [Candidatus Hydrogenedentota bacterium]
MFNRITSGVISGMVLMSVVPNAAVADFDKPVIKTWIVQEKNDKGEMEDVKYMTIDGVLVHEEDPAKQPPPRVVTPGIASTRKPGGAPADAVVLFDGQDLENWISDKDNAPTKWVVKDGTMMPTKDSGMIRTKQEFGSCQLHLEFACPKIVEGDGQGRGNSGVFLMGEYEVQILDSYDNATYPDGQCAALYGRAVPLVNACRKPGEWQIYDIIFHRPLFHANGQVTKRATFTVIQNGVLVQDHVELSGGNGWLGHHAVTDYVPHGDKGPLKLQDHGNPVLFRNVWIRELPD